MKSAQCVNEAPLQALFELHGQALLERALLGGQLVSLFVG